MKNFTIISNNKIAVLVASVLLIASSCKTKFYEEPAEAPASAGGVDFSKYVAVGSTITSGFADNALYNEGQDNSYPSLIAGQINQLNGNLHFVQPDIGTNSGWSGTAAKGRYLLEIPTCTTVAIGGVAQPGESAVLAYAGDKTKLTNLAVPFIRVTNINTAAVSAGTAYNNPGPYYANIVNTGTTKGIASEAKARGASFFTVWLGYVDALRYATSGGTTAMVSTAVFKQNIEALLDSLLAVPGSKGIIGTVLYVDQFPTVFNNNRRFSSLSDPARSPVYLTQTQVDQYNTDLGGNYFKGGPGTTKNHFVIQVGPTASSIRQFDPTKDFFVRSNVMDSIGIGERDPNAVRSCTPNHQIREEKGLSTPVNTNAVLDEGEIAVMRNQIDAYNAAIREAVAARNSGSKRIGIVDLNDFFTRLYDPLQGIRYGSVVIRANHANLGPDYGGFFSLDRLNPTPKGQAALANEFIKAINSTFGSNIHLLDPTSFRGNLIPSN